MPVRRWTFISAALISLGLALSWLLGSAMVRPAPSAVQPAMPPARDLLIVTDDGVSLAATYWPGRRAHSPGVLLLHGNGASREAMAANAAWLPGRGYAVLTIDFRGHGQSTMRPRSFGFDESRDAIAALAWLRRSQGGARIAVIGVSLGGAASLIGRDGPIAADALILQAVYPDMRRAIRNRIAFLVTDPPAFVLEPLLSYQSRPRFGVWPDGLSPVAAMQRFSGPVFVIGGGADRFTPPDETRMLFDAARGPKALWFANGADHAEASGLQDEAYRRNVLRFIERSIGQP